MIDKSPWSVDYTSPEKRAGWFSRTFPSLAFYPGLWSIVSRAAKLAKRGQYDDVAWTASSAETVELVEKLGGQIIVEGAEHLASPDGPVVYVGNHMSTLETFALPSILRPYGPVTFVVKQELVEMPVFKHVMTSRDPVVVGRKNPREDLRTMMEQGQARLKSGISIIVFPQRTRAPWFAPHEFNSIAVKLAKRAGVPVVPIALRSDLWGISKFKPLKDFGPIRPSIPLRFAFGLPMSVEGNGKATHEKVINFITTKANEWDVPVRTNEPESP